MEHSKASGVYPAGVQPTSFVAADFNSDAKIDLVVASETAGLGLLLGNGDGTFQPVTFFYSQITQISATADLNGDGTSDLIVGQNILLGNGDGTFRVLPAQQLPGLGIVNVVDLNGDGKLDLVGDSANNADLEYALGNGDGTFAAPVVLLPFYKFGAKQVSF